MDCVQTQGKDACGKEARRLLVVDDDPLSLDMFARRLERSGYRVTRAESGQEALDCIAGQSFDLMLLDYNMPEMTGLEVLRSVRKIYSQLEFPVILVTAVVDSQITAEALEVGANDYITKPIDYIVAMARISSQLKRRTDELQLVGSDHRDAMAAWGSNDGLWDWDLESNEMYFSPRWTEILGYTDPELENSPTEWFSRIHPEDSNALQQGLEVAIAGVTEQFESEHRLQHKDGTWLWVRSRAKAVFNPQGRAERITGTLTDITAGKLADPLTNLPNRSALLERLAVVLARARREQGNTFAVLIIDVDRFKVINDGLGHCIGDELLVGIAQRLREAATEAAGFVARLGGDEFAVLVERLADTEQVTRLAAAIRQEIAAPFKLAGREVLCSMSIGAALGPDDCGSVEDLLRDADTAMYRAKALGGARLEVFCSEMRQRAVARLDLELDLRRSLEDHDFEVYYQPKVGLSDDRVIGFEALVRWIHPRLGLMYPDDFIPLAEETGLIVPLGRWVLEEAVRQLLRWQARFQQAVPLVMSVNLSCRQFLDPDLVKDIQHVLTESGLDARTLHLELTESVFIDDAEGALKILEQLKRLGLGLKMDDFGTGYSSLSSLSRLPFDSVKIDRSFVANLGTSEGSEIIKTVIQLAGTLGMSVVAEGVETRAQLDALRILGCNYAQGYYFSKPVRSVDAEKTLSEGWVKSFGCLDLASVDSVVNHAG